jgi:hypothetical protein
VPNIKDLNEYFENCGTQIGIEMVIEEDTAEDVNAKFDIVIDDICYLGEKEIENVQTMEQALESIESFSIGHHIPWSFEDPMYGSSFTTHFTTHYKTGQRRLAVFEKKAQQVDSTEIELWRTLLLQKYQQLEYAKHMLNFFNLQRKKAKRGGFDRQEYTFELGYHFTLYQLIMSSCLDVTARIIRYRHFRDFSFRHSNWKNTDFQKRVKGTLYTNLLDFLQSEEMKDWHEILNAVRNFSAHEGTTLPTSILMEPEGGIPSYEEISSDIRESKAYKNMVANVGAHQASVLLPTMVYNKKMELYNVVSEHVVVHKKGEKMIKLSMADGPSWLNDKYTKFFDEFMHIVDTEDDQT